MDELTRRIELLSQEQRELLELRLKKKRGEAANSEIVAKAFGTIKDQEVGSALLDASLARPDNSIQFSLFYFASDEEMLVSEKYQLLIDGAKFADQHDFTSVWIPERHFHRFGGLYPNPSVLGAALAMITKHIQIRAGSVVLPLHHPIRIAEEWSMVDNLSNGRIGIAFASGWHTNDFVFAPKTYMNRKEVLFQNIKTLQRLWQGDAITVLNGSQEEIEVRLFPKPIQNSLPIWITSAGNMETYIKAGEIGANVLTALMDLSMEQLMERIARYRESLAKHGHNPQTGKVTVMLHTFIADDIGIVRSKAREPFYNYLRSHNDLVKSMAKNLGIDLSTISVEDENALLSYAFEHYLNTDSLIGTPDKCMRVLKRLSAIGVNEIACLVDFGIAPDDVMQSLLHVKDMKDQFFNGDTASLL